MKDLVKQVLVSFEDPVDKGGDHHKFWFCSRSSFVSCLWLHPHSCPSLYSQTVSATRASVLGVSGFFVRWRGLLSIGRLGAVLTQAPTSHNPSHECRHICCLMQKYLISLPSAVLTQWKVVAVGILEVRMFPLLIPRPQMRGGGMTQSY